jgi:hypothetical protein
MPGPDDLDQRHVEPGAHLKELQTAAALDLDIGQNRQEAVDNLLLRAPTATCRTLLKPRTASPPAQAKSQDPAATNQPHGQITQNPVQPLL